MWWKLYTPRILKMKKRKTFHWKRSSDSPIRFFLCKWNQWVQFDWLIFIYPFTILVTLYTTTYKTKLKKKLLFVSIVGWVGARTATIRHHIALATLSGLLINDRIARLEWWTIDSSGFRTWRCGSFNFSYLNFVFIGMDVHHLFAVFVVGANSGSIGCRKQVFLESLSLGFLFRKNNLIDCSIHW